MKRIILIILLVVFSCTLASAESLVWKAQKGDSTIYLGGTFHVLREADYPLPPEFDEAYREADIVVFETDIGKLRSPATKEKILEKSMYADGSTIDEHLSASAYGELSAYCAANNIPLKAFSRFKPSMLMTVLTFLELRKLGVTEHGVDEFFYEKAREDGKAVMGLETIDEQIDYIAAMADDDEDAFVSYSLDDLKTVKTYFETLAEAWREGAAEKLDELMTADFKAKQPELYRKMVVDRNRKWLPLIDAYLETPGTEFILVGAAHLVGADGIIEALIERGYRVDKVSYDGNTEPGSMEV